jgi:uncharacterized membrane protein YdfJ with MMPL/SSD domain
MPIAPVIAGLGGILAIVEAFLVWESVTLSPVVTGALGAQAPKSLSGLDMDANWVKISIVLGLIVLGLAAAWIMNLKVPKVALIVTVVGVLLLLVALLGVSRSLDDLKKFNDAMDAIKAAGADIGNTSAGIGPGLICDVVAGILVVVGGGLGLMKKSA